MYISDLHMYVNASYFVSYGTHAFSSYSSKPFEALDIPGFWVKPFWDGISHETISGFARQKLRQTATVLSQGVPEEPAAARALKITRRASSV